MSEPKRYVTGISLINPDFDVDRLANQEGGYLEIAGVAGGIYVRVSRREEAEALLSAAVKIQEMFVSHLSFNEDTGP